MNRDRDCQSCTPSSQGQITNQTQASLEHYADFLSDEATIQLYQKDNNVVIEMDLGMVEPDNLDVSIEDGKLYISALEEHEQESEYGNYFYTESFERIVPLPEEINEQTATADFTNGLLTITLPVKAAGEISSTQTKEQRGPGRPKGSKNKAKSARKKETSGKVGRPKGSKNKRKVGRPKGSTMRHGKVGRPRKNRATQIPLITHTQENNQQNGQMQQTQQTQA